ncbi:MAG: hypothetical protein RL748_4372 [Pseudomonadota bacterium]|jgi:hypothetical protein
MHRNKYLPCLRQTLAPTLIALLCAGSAQAATQNPRVIWDNNPDQNITIGFGSNASTPYLMVGSSTDEATWTRANVTRSATFNSSLVSQFVQLSNLTPNSAYYFRACDSSGCGARYWFKTARSTPGNMTFISGGDSRTNRGERQQANRMVAKLRPAFVDFGGDLTDNNIASQMLEWLTDWELTFSSDTINGIAYKYIPGLVVNVGNHEDNDQQFVCKVFGADSDRNGSCSNRDTYNAFNINGAQLRLYNLNSQLDWSGADFVAQSNWLKSDLAGAGAQAQWRIASYHRPALPRTSAKPTVNSGLFAWGQPFYDLKMNMVFESDSHVLKMTAPVKPAASGSDYQEVNGGTVYLGEGAWGAPKRPADRSASWLVDLDSLSHFNVLQFSGDQLLVRTVLFGSEASSNALTREQREADPLALPAGIPLRSLPTLGNVYALGRDANGRTIKIVNTSEQVLEQNNTGGYATSIRTSQKGAQSFKHGSTGTYSVSKLTLYVSRNTSTPAGTLDVFLGTGVNSGELANTRVNVASASITNTSSGSSFQKLELTLPAPVTLSAGKTYYLNLSTSSSNVFYVEYANSSSAYTNGTYYRGGSDYRKDLHFNLIGK